MADTHLTVETAQQLITAALMAHNVAEDNAKVVAKALVAAEIDGQGGHGFSRVAAYAAQAHSGKVDGHATPTVEALAPAIIRVDAHHGFAFPALERAIDALPPLARSHGIAAASVVRSHHCGQLGAVVERLAKEDLLALMVANTPQAMAPWGGSRALFGTNPIAFAAPGPEGQALVIDLSLSRVARGKVMAAAQRGEAIPEGWALDAAGRPTTDPQAALQGTMVPAGEAKGAALALMVEVLAATLTGANYSFEASSFFDAQGDPPGVGQFLIVVDAAACNPGFGQRLAQLTSAVTAQEGARLPGDGRHGRRTAAREQGIPIPSKTLAALKVLAEP